jgi:hypothetical protein
VQQVSSVSELELDDFVLFAERNEPMAQM